MSEVVSIAGYSRKQLDFLIACPLVFAAGSIAGSSIILVKLYRKGKTSRQGILNTFDRLLFLLSMLDILTALNEIFGVFMSPKWTHLFLALGTETSCTIHATIFQFGVIAAAFCNVSMCIFFVLVVVYSKSNRWIRERLELVLITVPLVFGLIASITPLALRCLAYDGIAACWIAPSPHDCLLDGEKSCRYCSESDTIRWIFMGVPVAFAFVFITMSMIWIYKEVRAIEKNNLQHVFRASSSSRLSRRAQSESEAEAESSKRKSIFVRMARRLSRTQKSEYLDRVDNSRSELVSKQGIRYSSVFLLIWVFTYSRRLAAMYGDEYNYTLHLLSRVFLVFQGFFNYLIFRKKN